MSWETWRDGNRVGIGKHISYAMSQPDNPDMVLELEKSCQNRAACIMELDADTAMLGWDGSVVPASVLQNDLRLHVIDA